MVRGLFLVIRLLAGIPFAAVYTSNPLFAWVWGLIYVLFLTACCSAQAWTPAGAALLFSHFSRFAAVILLTRYADERAALRLTALDVGQGPECRPAVRNGAVVVDCGGAAKENNAGDTAARYILGRCRQEWMRCCSPTCTVITRMGLVRAANRWK
jgi:hypothetical protein